MKNIKNHQDLTLNQTIKPEMIKEKIKEENFQCSLCQDRGYVLRVHEEYLYSDECICIIPKKIEKNIVKSGISPYQRNFTLDNFLVNNHWQRDFKEFAMNFVKNHNSKWFFISGQVGSGKSHLCIGISLGLINQEKSVILMSWRDSIVRLKAMIMDVESYMREIDVFKKCEVLCIDDFLKTSHDKNPTDAEVNIASEIIDYRYRNGLITIINSEKNIDDILEISESVGSRIIQQTIGYYIDIPSDPSKNYRLRECGQYE